jgi:hypothetical protein
LWPFAARLTSFFSAQYNNEALMVFYPSFSLPFYSVQLIAKHNLERKFPSLQPFAKENSKKKAIQF